MKTKNFYFNSFCFLRRYYNIPKSRKLSWCIIKECTRSGTELRLGASLVGTNTYIDIARRRFFSEVKLPAIERTVFPAKRSSQGAAYKFLCPNNGCEISKPKSYMEDIYNVALYTPELMKKTLL